MSNTQKSKKKIPLVESSLASREAQESLEQTNAELSLPDPTPEQAQAILKFKDDEIENV